MKVLFLTLNPDLQGPLPKLTPLLISSLEKLGCQVTRSTWGRHAEHENLYMKLVGRFRDAIRVLVRLITIQPDVLFVASSLDERALVRDVPLLLATAWSPAVKVLMMHGSKTSPLFEQGNSLYKLFTHLLIRMSDAVLLLSMEEVKKWSAFGPKGRYYRVDNPCEAVIPGVVEMLSNTSFGTMPPTLLYVGRLIKEKGVFELLESMPLILQQTDCRLFVVGDGAEKGALLQRVESLNLDCSVSLLGYLEGNRLAEVYRSASLLILPTFHPEGFPSVITEAMSVGLPIITTRVGGIPDHLKEGINAIFIQPNDPTSIANAVVRLLNDPKLCLEMRYANLTKIKDFAPENVVHQYVDIFGELLRSKA